MGNPGSRYKETRHNIGFAVVSRLAEGEGLKITKKGFSSLWAKGKVGMEEAVFLLPQTFMNRSGEAVRECRDFYRIENRDLILVHDDLDLPLGRIKSDSGAGSAGHRGVASVIEVLGTQEFQRIRIGIGRPASKEEVEAFVLSPFEKEDEGQVTRVLEEAEKILRREIA